MATVVRVQRLDAQVLLVVLVADIVHFAPGSTNQARLTLLAWILLSLSAAPHHNLSFHFVVEQDLNAVLNY